MKVDALNRRVYFSMYGVLAKLVDAGDLNSLAERRKGSIPLDPTNRRKIS